MIIILVFGPKGGCGKTATARNLAVRAVSAGLRVATLDADPQGSLSLWLKARPGDAPVIRGDRIPLADIAGPPMSDPDVDLLVIDTPTAVEAWPTQIGILIDSADLVLLPVQPTGEDIASMSSAMRLVRSRGRRAMFVINRANPRRVETREARRMLAGMGEVAPLDMPDLVEFPRSFSAGLGVTEWSGALSVRDVDALWSRVADMLGIERGASQ